MSSVNIKVLLFRHWM